MKIINLRQFAVRCYFQALIVRFLILLLISLFLLNKTNAKNIRNINWDALQFSCNTEQNPPFDEESDVWFQRARALEKVDDENNDAEMIYLYQKASERGHYKAMLNLAILYAHGRSIKINRRKAVDLVEKAMKMQSARAYYLMGIMLEQGVGVKPDKIAALSYFRKSADMGNKYGQYATGEAIRDAVVKQEESIRQRGYAIAVQMLECSLSQGYAEAGYTLGWHYEIFENEIDQGLQYFQKAAALGHNKSLFHLYSTFGRGENAAIVDSQLAACYYTLLTQVRADPNIRFPDIDHLCPLPALLLQE